MEEENNGGNECHCRCEHVDGKPCRKCLVFHRSKNA